MTVKHISSAPLTTQDRDVGMVRAMGGFFTLLGGLVWIGQCWEQTNVERVVNALSGAILLTVGGLMVWRHRKTAMRRSNTP